jgi:acyl-CoA synthetase (NDP forming)
MSARGVPDQLRAEDLHIPSYAFPEAAAIALARAARYGEWLRRPVPAAPALPDLRRREAAAVIAAALRRGSGWLAPDEVEAVLACYGLPFVDQRVVSTIAEAAAAAAQFGGPVALKAIAVGVVHRSEVGAVQLGLEGADRVREAAEAMTRRLAEAGAPVTGYVVQRMAPRGVEMIAGVVHDRQFGPLIACGTGGVLVELLGDVRVRLTPLAREEAQEMIRELKTYPLLAGFRGQPPADVAALEDALVRLSALADDLPDIAELDCNPIIVHQRGIAIVDARIRVEPAMPPRPLGARG